MPRQLTILEAQERYNFPVDHFLYLSDENKVKLFRSTQLALQDALNLLHSIQSALLAEKQLSLFLPERTDLKVENTNSTFSQFIGHGSRSEKVEPLNPTTPAGEDNPPPKKIRVKGVKLPSERYPNVPVRDYHLRFSKEPACPCCQHKMKEMGQTEDSEIIHKIPAKVEIVRLKRHKYRCSHCHGAIYTVQTPPRITPGGVFSDNTIIDISLQKYARLIPLERVTRELEREGLKNLPHQTVIEVTHALADHLSPVYDKLKKDVQSHRILYADETPHRMLEGGSKPNWYLWGFSTKHSAYFEIQDTRSGDVATEFLKQSECRYLVSDVYTGYSKSVREVNESFGKEKIRHVFCNAHARRYFVEAMEDFPEAKFFVEKYQEIYLKEKILQESSDPPEEKIRKEQKQLMISMLHRALELREAFPEKSRMNKAVQYLVKNYRGLVEFTEDTELPVDNNHSERLLRNPVIGRKTWYGNHSERGARTSAILFSIVESCKLCGVDPWEYVNYVVGRLHINHKQAVTPLEYVRDIRPTLYPELKIPLDLLNFESQLAEK